MAASSISHSSAGFIGPFNHLVGSPGARCSCRRPVGPGRGPSGLVHNCLNLFHALQAHGHQRLYQCVVQVLHVRRQVAQEPAQIKRALMRLFLEGDTPPCFCPAHIRKVPAFLQALIGVHLSTRGAHIRSEKEQDLREQSCCFNVAYACERKNEQALQRAVPEIPGAAIPERAARFSAY